MTDWTLILTTLGAAGFAGGFGYLSAQQQGKVALRQIEAENERLREQHREEHLRNRQSTYHEFVTADRDFANAVAEGALPEWPGGPNAWRRHFHHVSNGVMLFGTPAVRAATLNLLRTYAEVVGEAGAFEDDTAERRGLVRDAFAAREREINDMREAVFEAMRVDVAPESRAG